jgi:hypothetical protein
VPTLFTYTIPIDDGAAPNPFGGMCTLAICKPGIRRVAKKGDWVVGLGSKNAPSGDLSKRIVYAMRVQKTMSLEDYDKTARRKWKHRIPKMDSPDIFRRLGDCIYDYSKSANPRQRRGVHGHNNKKTDLSGENALVSRDFYYFGRNAIKLPRKFHRICHQTQGHRSTSNDEYFARFERWIRKQPFEPRLMHGWPDYKVDWTRKRNSCAPRERDGRHDRPC